MTEKKIIGRLGEELASKYLMEIGYKILERNYSTKFAEADIIALDGDNLVIVEVKTRKNYSFAAASTAVNYSKQQKLLQLGLNYMQENNLYSYNLRMDIFECYYHDKKINHLIAAF